jgi:putative glutathione S-transferase
LLARSVKGLDDVVGASVVYFRRDPDNGWQFNPAIPGCTPDLAEASRFVVDRYRDSGSDERSVPVLWDTKSKSIVNNESAEILRMFNGAFGDLARRDIDLYPEGFRTEIDRLNAAVYQRINNGAYKAGFASSQRAYERAFDRYFRAFRWIDGLLGERDWLAGTVQMSEADLRLFPTIFRHDEVYYSRFKLNAARLDAYPNLERWLDAIMGVPGVAEASSLDHARNGYFGRTGNEIVPAGPSPLGLSRKDFSDDVWLNRG